RPPPDAGGPEPPVRPIAEQAYKHGGRFVDVNWFDPHVKRARIEHAVDADSLEFVPPWYGNRLLGRAREGGPIIVVNGATEPGLLGDLDPARVGRDRLPAIKESIGVINDRSVNW